MLDEIDLYKLLVENIIGGYLLTIIVLAILLVVILGALGRMSRLSVMYFVMTFLMVMFIGSGFKIFVILLTLLATLWLVMEVYELVKG